MKGIILAGGSGKQLLPVYGTHLTYYPLLTEV